MSEHLRLITFAAVGAPRWGAILDMPEAALIVAASDGVQVWGTEMVLDGGDPADRQWRIETPGAVLSVTPDGTAQASGETGREQPCRVSGSVTVDGQAVSVEAPGRRALHPALGPSVASLRDVSTWFDGQGAAMHAVRPTKSAGHAEDRIDTAVFEADKPAVPVAEARLSTTYAEHERPIRVGLELWLGEDEGEQYPLRVAGEAADAGVSVDWGRFRLRVVPLRAHARGREGAGIYLLAQRR